MEILKRHKSLCLIKTNNVFYVCLRKKYKHDNRRRKVLKRSVRYINQVKFYNIVSAYRFYQIKKRSI